MTIHVEIHISEFWNLYMIFWSVNFDLNECNASCSQRRGGGVLPVLIATAELKPYIVSTDSGHTVSDMVTHFSFVEHGPKTSLLDYYAKDAVYIICQMALHLLLSHL